MEKNKTNILKDQDYIFKLTKDVQTASGKVKQFDLYDLNTNPNNVNDLFLSYFNKNYDGFYNFMEFLVREDLKNNFEKYMLFH